MANGWKIFGIIIISLAVLSLVACGICGIIGSSDSDDQTGTSNQGSGAYTPTQPSTPSPVVGHVGDVFTSQSYSDHIEWSVTQTIRGYQANSIVASGNMFNSEPAPGYEYLLYNIYVKNVGTEPYSIYHLAWRVYADGVETGTSYVVLPDSYRELESIDIRSGASTDGWMACEVPTGSNVRIYYEPLFSYGSSEEVYVII